MYRSFSFVLTLIVLMFLASGCAKQPQPSQEPVTQEVAEVAPAAQPATAPKAEKAQDPIEEAGLFALEASALHTVYFDFDSHQLTPQAMTSLKENVELLKTDPTFKVTVAGHCDERGSDEYNMSLGELRALAVKNYLAQLGVEAERLAVISYGEEQPAVAGSTEEAWAKNRRVEFN